MRKESTKEELYEEKSDLCYECGFVSWLDSVWGKKYRKR